MRSIVFSMCLSVLAGEAAASTLDLTAVPDSPNQVLSIERASGVAGTYLLSRNGTLEHYNPTTGQRTVVLAGVTPAGGTNSAYDVAFAPDFETSGKVYVSLRTTDNVHEVVEYTLSSDGSLVFAPESRRVVLSIDHGDAPAGAHFGGAIDFGPDGALYVTTGDSDQPLDETLIVSQDVTDRRGKVLRIDPFGIDAYPDDPTNNYAIPTGNPDFGSTGDPSIWAIGLRNPFRATFDEQTGQYLIADVGEDLFEEINIGASGANYGWSAFEGLQNVGGELSPLGTLTDPLFDYGRMFGGSVTGGLVYYGPLE